MKRRLLCLCLILILCSLTSCSSKKNEEDSYYEVEFGYDFLIYLSELDIQEIRYSNFSENVETDEPLALKNIEYKILSNEDRQAFETYFEEMILSTDSGESYTYDYVIEIVRQENSLILAINMDENKMYYTYYENNSESYVTCVGDLTAEQEEVLEKIFGK